MKYVILTIALAIILLPTSKSDKPPSPQPVPVPVVEKDLLDKNTDVYRELMSEVWKDFADKRSTFESDEVALKWINERQLAAWKAAYNSFSQKAATAAQSADTAKSFSEALKNRKLQ